uniref:Uncharacterized protein n=1 Tax=Cyanothece sp. (strain PCC 7425 / ATCC 29141) TaxID=395961 RepID=B8HSK7_CYAP4
MDISVTDILVLLAFGLLVVVTGGIGYLTLVDWRDRRRLAQEQKELRRSRRR